MRNLTQLLLLLQQEIEILRDVALHVFADRCTPGSSTSLADVCWRYVLDSLSRVSVSEIDAGTCSFANSRSFVTCLG